MFERHIYTDDFFRFVKDVCNTLKVPDEVTNQYPLNFIYPQHNTLSAQVKESIGSLTQVLAGLVVYLLARAHDNNVIYLSVYSLLILLIDYWRAWRKAETILISKP